MLDIALDLDDTICDTASIIMEKAIKFHQSILHRKVDLFEVSDCEDYFYFAHKLGWGKDEVCRFFEWCYPYYLKEVKVLNDVADVLKELHALNCKIHIITARYASDKEDVELLTREWLKNNNIVYDTLDIGQCNKTDMIAKYNCKVFVDDSFKNCCAIKDCFKDTLVMIMNSAYNINLRKDGIVRVNDWKEIKNSIIKFREVIYE